ncbi:MAG: C69 family dipeptidase [Acidobacteria bacterium]|nr:C69 family dipeptidase [Acidobacteriota bacterium]
MSANRPRIPELKLADKDNYMASENVFQVAKDLGWWKEGEPFVFHKAYGGGGSLGSTRREWRVLSTMAPSLKLDPSSTSQPSTRRGDTLRRGHRDLPWRPVTAFVCTFIEVGEAPDVSVRLRQSP